MRNRGVGDPMSESWHSAYVKTPRTLLGVYQVFEKLLGPFCVTEEGTGDQKGLMKEVAFSLDQIGKTWMKQRGREKELEKCFQDLTHAPLLDFDMNLILWTTVWGVNYRHICVAEDIKWQRWVLHPRAGQPQVPCP